MMRRLEGLALKSVLESAGDKLKSELPEPQEPLPSKLALLLEKLETAEASGKAVLLEEDTTLRARVLLH
jgi:hypothetical protein